MTADRPFGAADDLELLAEYAAGLLDGTPEAAELAARLEREPELASLHAALTTADPLVRADLSALPAAAMPSDVAAELDALLAAEPPLTTTSPLIDSPPGDVVPMRARRRPWLAKVAAVAAGVAIFGAIAVNSDLLPGTSQPESATSAGADRHDIAQEPNAESGLKAPAAGSNSGTEYTSANLAAQAAALVRKAPRQGPRAQLAPDAQYSAQPLLKSCLTALGWLTRALAVDRGSFDGSPALIVVARGATDAEAEVAVVGPDCGRGGNTDERLRTTVSLSR